MDNILILITSLREGVSGNLPCFTAYERNLNNYAELPDHVYTGEVVILSSSMREIIHVEE